MLTDSIRAAAADAFEKFLPSVTGTILRRANSHDTTGAPVDDWQSIGAVIGRLRLARGQRESFQGEQSHAAVDFEWVMTPYDLATFPVPDAKRLKAKDRLRIGGREFDVIGSDEGRTGAIQLVYQLTAVE